MYDWLNDALQESSLVVTANRRLARVLIDAHAGQQVAAGRLAWRTPNIVAWSDCLARLLDQATATQDSPLRINEHQSRVLWERCLRREISDPLLNVSMLVRQAQEAWTRLHDWCVPLDDCIAAAAGRDQKVFASAAAAYQSVLERQGWTDGAGMAGLVTRVTRRKSATLPGSITLAGFDRFAPSVEALIAAMQQRGVMVARRSTGDSKPAGRVVCYENAEAELRAAGAWAREQLDEASDRRIGIVSSGLDKDADRIMRLVREGFAPGWQTADTRFSAAVNVSYGRRLSAYPVIAAAFAALTWCDQDISSRQLSHLLRTPAIGRGHVSGRSRLELALRQMPARLWSPQMCLNALGAPDDHTGDARDFLQRVQGIAERRNNVPRQAAPSDWASLIVEILTSLHWPGDGTLDSREFQLVNRWRELLNEFARLELIEPAMTFGQALGRLQALAAETVFQPESDGALVHLLGPLEAAGMEFDALWVAGMTAASWPPDGRPSPLLSRQLQRDHGMPDADPADTLAYAERVLLRLAASSSRLRWSYARTDDDAEQTGSLLLDAVATTTDDVPADPGWHATRIAETASPARVRDDPVPAVCSDEDISGGAATIQRQFTEPFEAFAYGRLGIRPLYPIPDGLPPNLRGSLIHDALYHLYRQNESRDDIRSLSDQELDDRIAASMRKAFGRHEITVDNVLRELLRLEKKRVEKLLRAVVDLDVSREYFEIVELEGAYDLALNDVRFRIRIDRIDRSSDGTLQVIDYKTGQPQQFLGNDKEPKGMQLVVYALALDETIADLAYINVDSRSVNLDGAGETFSPDLAWQDCLRRWSLEVERAVQEFAGGDVRLQAVRSANTGRMLGLLSRIRELQRNAG